MSELVPLEKLISRLRTDLKLTKSSWAVKTLGGEVSYATQRKNHRKASILFYLEELQALKAAKKSESTKEAEKSRVVVAYRAKFGDSTSWIMHTYGSMCGDPIEGSTMKDLAYSIAYLYHRHPVELYVSYDGKTFSKAGGALAKTFDKIMDDEFRYDEWRH